MKRENASFAPDFFIVGAAKSGTTAVYHWLQDHPEVFLPEVKEPGYFAYQGGIGTPANGPYDPEYVRQITVDTEAYAKLYQNAGTRMMGDISPVYLVSDKAASRIARIRPDARIVIMLRDPVARAFSQYLHNMRENLEPCASFEDALAAEVQRLNEGWSWGHGYVKNSCYAAQIDRYISFFPPEQILFIEYQELQLNPEKCWQKICEHLSIMHQPLLRNERVNVTKNLKRVSARPNITRRLQHPGVIQSFIKKLLPSGLRTWLRYLVEGQGRPVPVLTATTKHELMDVFAKQRSRVERQTGLALDHWESTIS